MALRLGAESTKVVARQFTDANGLVVQHMQEKLPPPTIGIKSGADSHQCDGSGPSLHLRRCQGLAGAPPRVQRQEVRVSELPPAQEAFPVHEHQQRVKRHMIRDLFMNRTHMQESDPIDTAPRSDMYDGYNVRNPMQFVRAPPDTYRGDGTHALDIPNTDPNDMQTSSLYVTSQRARPLRPDVSSKEARYIPMESVPEAGPVLQQRVHVTPNDRRALASIMLTKEELAVLPMSRESTLYDNPRKRDANELTGDASMLRFDLSASYGLNRDATVHATPHRHDVSRLQMGDLLLSENEVAVMPLDRTLMLSTSPHRQDAIQCDVNSRLLQTAGDLTVEQFLRALQQAPHRTDAKQMNIDGMRLSPEELASLRPAIQLTDSRDAKLMNIDCMRLSPEELASLRPAIQLTDSRDAKNASRETSGFAAEATAIGSRDYNGRVVIGDSDAREQGLRPPGGETATGWVGAIDAGGYVQTAGPHTDSTRAFVPRMHADTSMVETIRDSHATRTGHVASVRNQEAVRTRITGHVPIVDIATVNIEAIRKQEVLNTAPLVGNDVTAGIDARVGANAGEHQRAGRFEMVHNSVLSSTTPGTSSHHNIHAPAPVVRTSRNDVSGTIMSCPMLPPKTAVKMPWPASVSPTPFLMEHRKQSVSSRG